MIETGEVIEVFDGMAKVRFKRGKLCGKCHACMSFSDDMLVTEIKNTKNARVGDIVSISLHEKSIVSASLIMYGIPLIMLILGVFLGSLINDYFAAGFGVVFAFGTYFILRLFEKRFKRIEGFTPKMVAVERSDGNKCN